MRSIHRGSSLNSSGKSVLFSPFHSQFDLFWFDPLE
jgi:hypothetical protein